MAGNFRQIFLRGVAAARRRHFVLGFIGRAGYIVERGQPVPVRLLVEKEGKIFAAVVLVTVKTVEAPSAESLANVAFIGTYSPGNLD